MNLLKRSVWRWLAMLMCGSAAAAPAPAPSDCDGPGFARVLQASPPLAAEAVWLNRRLLRWPGAAAPDALDAHYWLLSSATDMAPPRVGAPLPVHGTRVRLAVSAAPVPATLAQRFAYLRGGPLLRLPDAALLRLARLVRQPLWLAETDAGGRVRRITATQIASLLDDLFASAGTVADLGATVAAGRTGFKLWAPTAERVALCLYRDGRSASKALLHLRRDNASGVWSARLPADLSGSGYTYLVDVFVPGTGRVRNRVTDPYSLSLSTDSQRSWIVDLNAPALQPEGWNTSPRPDKPLAATDLVIYELHLRDFSAADASVPAADRGKYLAFTHAESSGMRHLRAMAAAGLTDVHLLPVFDFSTVPEQGCVTPDAAALARLPPDIEAQQAAVMASAAGDCFNWGYDPWHYTAPEGSYASDAGDGAVRIVEFRRMVQALHAAGLRVGMDMVYNHTSAAGQAAHSVLDRVVPGYYQRLDAQGRVETSTCCANTATEHLIMGKLMVDSAVVWARDHRIDSFRFDLMGHQPRAAMEALQRAVDAASGRHIHLIGEGWNFGEVKDGARFVQAAQGRLDGSGIATFSDRGRDAFRERRWSADDSPQARDDALRNADLLRVGLAGTLRDYRMAAADGKVVPLTAIDYRGQPAGYASQPGEVVNYVENHDNPTLFDQLAMALPRATSREDRARIQVLGLAFTAFSQGIAYFHAGVEMLRSKSLDRNSYDSGDWFNRLDWTFTDNGFGSGLPPARDNDAHWPAMQPLLADPDIKPTPRDIAFTRDAFMDLLRLRASTALLRLRTAKDVQARLQFLNTGPQQVAGAIVGHLDGQGLPGAGFAEVLYAINTEAAPLVLHLPALQGRPFVLHPVHLRPDAADPRPAAQSGWDAASATLRLPPLTALVYVRP
jgi:pullulanase/glycogen debranching enzyme